MLCERKLLLSLFVVMAAMVVGLVPSTTWAQRDAGAKARGEFGKGFWSNQRASRNMGHARDYSRGFYRYSRDAHTIQPEVAKTESAELGRNIDAAKKELATVREEYAADKEVLASLKVIEDHLAKVAAQHATLHAACQQDTVDRTVGMECCNVITKELEKAMAEHAALMRKLEIKAESGDAKDKSSAKDE
jgi:hypothetical protein